MLLSPWWRSDRPPPPTTALISSSGGGGDGARASRRGGAAAAAAVAAPAQLEPELPGKQRSGWGASEQLGQHDLAATAPQPWSSSSSAATGASGPPPTFAWPPALAGRRASLQGVGWPRSSATAGATNATPQQQHGMHVGVADIVAGSGVETGAGMQVPGPRFAAQPPGMPGWLSEALSRLSLPWQPQ